MSVNRGGAFDENDFLNWTNLFWSNSFAPSANTTSLGPGSGGTNDTVDGTVDFVDLPDGHVAAILGFQHNVSDYEQVEGEQAYCESWVYNQSGIGDPNLWSDRVTASGEGPIDHFAFGANHDTTNGTGYGAQGTTDTMFPIPILNPDGELSVIYEGGTTDDDDAGEYAISVMYDIVSVDNTEKYLELLLRR